MGSASASSPQWAEMHNVERLSDGGYRTTGPSPSLLFNSFDPPVSSDRNYLLLEMSAAKPVNISFFWYRFADLPVRAKSFARTIERAGEFATFVIDLGELGPYLPKDTLRLNIGADAGLSFEIRRAELVGFNQLPKNLIPELIAFRCFTSKLHYLPGERIDYKATMVARNYPDRESSKILKVRLLDDKGECVATDIQHYGIQPLHGVKELFGVVSPDRKLKPGKYHLEATSTDQRSGLTLQWNHDLGVTGAKDPFVYETPFKFVKDFSIIKGPDGLWHMFSITGDFVSTHEWFEDGQERTFSHGTSPDLRHWTYHEPVLSITDDKYPDGRGKFKNRNIWAPHVIRHGDTYYMFYTTVNDYTSQSISLATSKDLFHWKDYERNPIITMEGVDWATWRRDAGAACRDPMVLEDGGKFYIYFTVDAKEGPETGVVAVAQSDDLIHWKSPQITVRGHIACESAQVWKSGDTYYMVTSSYGGGTFESKDPVKGWKPSSFPRAPLPPRERYVSTSSGYAEEVVRLDDGSILMAALTFRLWGNSIYLFRMKTDEAGRPVGYESPF